MARTKKPRGGKLHTVTPPNSPGVAHFPIASSPISPSSDKVAPVVLREPEPPRLPEPIASESPLPVTEVTESKKPADRTSSDSFVDEVTFEIRREKRLKLMLVWGGGGLIMLLLLLAIYLYNIYSTLSSTTVTVTSAHWAYSLPREDFALRDNEYTTKDENWTPPIAVQNVDSERVVVDYEPIYGYVPVPKTCFGANNQSYPCTALERQVIGQSPNYGTKWTWQEMEWATTTPLTASGNSYVVTYPKFVPTPTLRQAGEPVTTFSITIVYIDDDGEQQTTTRSYPRLVWEETSVGTSYDGLVDGFDRLRAIKGLDPQYEELTK